MATKTEWTSVRGPVVDLLNDIVFHSFRVKPAFAPLAGGSWGTFDLSSYTGTLRVRGDSLLLELQAHTPAAFTRLYNYWVDREQAKDARLVLADGSKVKGMFLAGQFRGADQTATLRFLKWDCRNDVTPRFWIARLRGRIPTWGNLSVLEKSVNGRNRVNHLGMRLDGRFTWSIVSRSKNSTWVVLECSKAFRRTDLVRELRCVEYAFGARLRLDVLTGIDDQRKAIAAHAPGYGPRRPVATRPPVHDDARCIPEFFRRLAARCHQRRGMPLVLATSGFLESIGLQLSNGYLLVQVASEAFATEMLREGPPKSAEQEAEDEAAWKRWKKWVDALEPQIKTWIRDGDPRLEVVMGKIKQAKRATTSERVEFALKGGGLKIPKSVLDEIALRNTSAHELLMSARKRKKTKSRVKRDPAPMSSVRRLWLIRSVLTALVAIYVGYKGDIQGYSMPRKAVFQAPSPTWWKRGELPALKFRAKRPTLAAD